MWEGHNTVTITFISHPIHPTRRAFKEQISQPPAPPSFQSSMVPFCGSSESWKTRQSVDEFRVGQPLEHGEDWRKLEGKSGDANGSYPAQDVRQRIGNLIQNQGEGRAGTTRKLSWDQMRLEN